MIAGMTKRGVAFGLIAALGLMKCEIAPPLHRLSHRRRSRSRLRLFRGFPFCWGFLLLDGFLLGRALARALLGRALARALLGRALARALLGRALLGRALARRFPSSGFASRFSSSSFRHVFVPLKICA